MAGADATNAARAARERAVEGSDTASHDTTTAAAAVAADGSASSPAKSARGA